MTYTNQPLSIPLYTTPTLAELTTFTLTVDGGCTDNQNRAIALGYYSMKLVNDMTGRERTITLDGKVGSHKRVALDAFFTPTNQVAELVVLTKALNYLVDLAIRCQASGTVVPTVVVHTDSKYATDWATGANKKKGVNVALTDELQRIYGLFLNYPSFSLVRVPREEIESVLGH